MKRELIIGIAAVTTAILAVVAYLLLNAQPADAPAPVASTTPSTSTEQKAISLAEVAMHARRPALVVGFAAETNDLPTYARDKLERKRLDLICANRVGVGATGFESDDNALLVLGREGLERALGPASKTELAASLLDLIAERLR